MIGQLPSAAPSNSPSVGDVMTCLKNNGLDVQSIESNVQSCIANLQNQLSQIQDPSQVNADTIQSQVSQCTSQIPSKDQIQTVVSNCANSVVQAAH